VLSLGVTNILQKITDISLPVGCFEMLHGDWPKPIEQRYTAAAPTLSTVRCAPSYRMQAKFQGLGQSGYVEMGRTFLVPADHEFLGRGTGGPVHVARWQFNRNVYEQVVGNTRMPSEEALNRGLNLSSPNINFLMSRAVDEIASPGFGSEFMLESLGSALLVECARQLYCSKPEAPGPHLSRHEIHAIDEYLETLETGIPRLAELARLSGRSSHYLSKLFRQSTGQSLTQYVAAWRMQRARKLLSDTSLSLKEIAFRLGFSDAANFSTAFRKTCGTTPALYRKTNSQAFASTQF
jgi:AraC family transcriptional regulator